jgi:hypothetical protein
MYTLLNNNTTKESVKEKKRRFGSAEQEKLNDEGAVGAHTASRARVAETSIRR